jgi:acetyl esterase/lipase
MADQTAARIVLGAMMALPTPVIDKIAGGGNGEQGGPVLDARVRLLANIAGRAPPIRTLGVENARRTSNDAMVLLGGRPERGVRAEAITIEGPAGPIALRAYRPKDQDPKAPVLVFAHGGGGVIGNLDTGDSLCRLLAKIARCAVLSVDYRLAPEHPFPAGLEDVLTAYRWTRTHTERFGAPPERLAIGGDSMGGNLAAVVAQTLKREGEPQPVVQVLIYPAVDMVGDYPSLTTHADAYPMDRPTMAWFLAQYLGQGADRAGPRCSPILAPDLTGLAPAVIATAGFDPLRDQGEAYADRLTAAGVAVSRRRYDTLPHGFANFIGAVPAARLACHDIAGRLKTAFEGAEPSMLLSA